MLTQFSSVVEGTPTLKELKFAFPIDAYPLGRLDKDSEGLLLLTNDKRLNNILLSPKQAHEREYYVQVEGEPNTESIKKLEKGVQLSDHFTKPAKVKILNEEPGLPERKPPIRFRKSVPTSWLSITLTEGKNRQVRRMTAAVGLPTLRLLRWRIEKITLGNMQPGDVIEMEADIFLKKIGITRERLEEKPKRAFDTSGKRSFDKKDKKDFRPFSREKKPFLKKPYISNPKNASETKYSKGKEVQDKDHFIEETATTKPFAGGGFKKEALQKGKKTARGETFSQNKNSPKKAFPTGKKPDYEKDFSTGRSFSPDKKGQNSSPFKKKFSSAGPNKSKPRKENFNRPETFAEKTGTSSEKTRTYTYGKRNDDRNKKSGSVNPKNTSTRKRK